MKAEILNKIDVSYISKLLLDEQGKIKLLPASVFEAIPKQELRLWCHQKARYGLPTTEVIEFLKEVIGTDPAIEIGAAYGDFGNLLDIPSTDSKIQQNPEVRNYYLLLGQPVIEYPSAMERLEALEAVEKYKPKIVIGSWITEWADPNLPPNGKSSVFGVKETELLSRVETYIVIGNTDVHGEKEITRNIPSTHTMFTIKSSLIKSRAKNPENNAIFVWTKSDRIKDRLRNEMLSTIF